METIGSTEKYEPKLQSCDPLAGFGDEVETTYHRVDCVVFAEPLSNEAAVKNNKQEDISSSDSTTTLYENVTVQRRRGRGKNIFVHLHDESNLDCPVQTCTKSFTSPTLLKTHIRKVHFSEKKHMCEVCGASFSAQYLLKRHSAVHGAERVQCPVCMKMLSLRTNLSQHLRSHSGTRRHECLACGKRFLRSSTLKAHLKAHKGACDEQDKNHEGIQNEED